MSRFDDIGCNFLAARTCTQLIGAVTPEDQRLVSCRILAGDHIDIRFVRRRRPHWTEEAAREHAADAAGDGGDPAHCEKNNQPLHCTDSESASLLTIWS